MATLKTNKQRIAEAKKAFKEARKIAKTEKSPLRGMTVDEVVAHTRKVREKLWEEKLAAHSRH